MRLAPAAWIFVAAAARAQSAAAPAPAAPVRAAGGATAVTRSGGGQPALAVGFDASGSLRAAVCSTTPCTTAGGEALAAPADAVAARASAKLSIMSIGGKRRAVHVKVPLGERAWEAVVAAPLGGAKPKVVFAGYTGLVEGEYGLRHGPIVLVSDAEDGHRIVIGEQREDLDLCGRPAVLAPQVLAPDLDLHPAKVQRLGREEREKAIRVTAKRVEEAAPPSAAPPAATPAAAPAAAVRLLRAVAATSAVGRPDALTDGDPATTWAENRGGAGKGEFVMMQAPPEVPIHGFDLVVRAPGTASPDAVAPKELWIATRGALVGVTMPEDGAKSPGARWRVELPAPVQTDCVALVVESGWHEGKKSQVTLAELSALAEFDASQLDGLVGALAGGGARAEAAGAVLRSAGPAAFAAVAKAFVSLDEGGRHVALDVLDHAPCATSAPAYLTALLGSSEGQRIHAADRFRRCGAEASPVLLQAFKSGKPEQRPLIAEELALIDPPAAVRALLQRIAKAQRRERAMLRVALAQATRSERAAVAVHEVLTSANVPEVAMLDLLRALGSDIGRFGADARAAFARLATPQASLRTRYLLLGPAAELAKTDAAAADFLRRALSTDPSEHVRAQAARTARDPLALRNELLAALADPGVRVREATVDALAAPKATFATDMLAARLAKDDWPLVRAAAARALASHGPSAVANAALGKAIDDESPHVRVPALLAVGARRATEHVERAREILADREDRVEVRVAATAALGMLCDTASLDELTKRARALADPTAPAADRVIGGAALAALGNLRPLDLATRVAPLRQRGVAVDVRAAVERALSGRGGCKR